LPSSAYWNFDASTDPTSTGFINSIWAMNDKLIAKQATTCPSKCACDQLTACGKPYLPK